jgi:hypothetical protein
MHVEGEVMPVRYATPGSPARYVRVQVEGMVAGRILVLTATVPVSEFVAHALGAIEGAGDAARTALLADLHALPTPVLDTAVTLAGDGWDDSFDALLATAGALAA